jgi:hypothetical protein
MGLRNENDHRIGLQIRDVDGDVTIQHKIRLSTTGGRRASHGDRRAKAEKASRSTSSIGDMVTVSTGVSCPDCAFCLTFNEYPLFSSLRNGVCKLVSRRLLRNHAR